MLLLVAPQHKPLTMVSSHHELAREHVSDGAASVLLSYKRPFNQAVDDTLIMSSEPLRTVMPPGRVRWAWGLGLPRPFRSMSATSPQQAGNNWLPHGLHCTDEALAAAKAALTGDIQQQAPMFSAVSVNGERLYKAARRGETVARAPRPVTVHSFELARDAGAPRDVHFRIACSKGTYIRSLAHDLVRRVCCLAYVMRACRLAQ